jgi:5-deoxy-glucuronate isomerase
VDLKFNYQPTTGLQRVVSPENSVLQNISLHLLNLENNQTYNGHSGHEELALVILAGRCTVTVGQQRFENIGRRKDVFGGCPYTVYIPLNSDYLVTAVQGAVEIAVCGAVCEQKREPALITPEEVAYENRGIWHWQRDIYNVINVVNPVSERLIIIEVLTPPGHWSSVPPHKHDQHNPPYESNLEEIYFYHMKPEQGFGFQRIYTDDGTLDEALVIEHNCATIQPKGYHPVANHPGYQMYYLNVLGGQERLLLPKDDPKHMWLKDVEQIIRVRE